VGVLSYRLSCRVRQEGSSYPTISRWLNENYSHYSFFYSVDDFSPKRIWTDEGTLDREFLELLNGKLEEGMRVQEFLAEYGKTFRAEDVRRFREESRRIAWCSTTYNLPLVK